MIFLFLRQCLLLFHSPVKLPYGHGSPNLQEDLFFPDSDNEDPYHGPIMPVSAIAGLVGDEAETFMVATNFMFTIQVITHWGELQMCVS